MISAFRFWISVFVYNIFLFLLSILNINRKLFLNVVAISNKLSHSIHFYYAVKICIYRGSCCCSFIDIWCNFCNVTVITMIINVVDDSRARMWFVVTQTFIDKYLQSRAHLIGTMITIVCMLHGCDGGFGRMLWEAVFP